jgi:hypothetical protein
MASVGLQRSLSVEEFPSVELRNDLGGDLIPARRQIPKACRKGKLGTIPYAVIVVSPERDNFDR